MKRIIMLTLILLSTTAQAQEYCPVDFQECLPLDFEEELERAHMLDPNLSPIGTSPNTSNRRRRIQDWELEAIRILTRGVIGKHYLDLIRTDDGAHGFAHFQPPNGLDIPEFEIYEEDIEEYPECFPEIVWIDDPYWVQDIQEVLYSPYTIAIQLREWRQRVGRAVRAAQRHGWDRDQLVVAAVIANSTGNSGFIALGERAEWDPEAVLQAYMDQRPNSLHRRRRASYLEDFL